MKTKQVVLCGLMTALMLALGYVETLLPLPGGMPGMKLGLANSILIYAVYMLPLPMAWGLMGLKVGLSALLFGNAGAALFSMAGGIMSMVGMSLLRRHFSPMAVSAVGGMLHNVGQVLVAMVLLHTPGLLGYLALLMVVGLITGLATGIAAQLSMKHLSV